MSTSTFSEQALDLARSNEILERNSHIIPGGLASVNRKSDPVIAFARARGSRMWDVSGKEYIDYHAGFAPYILGHNDPDQNAAVQAVLDAGRSNYGTGPTEDEGELARLFLDCLPLADAHGFLLILDEVKTGFRASLGGFQGLTGIQPDLSTFGKAFANGYPIAALAGKSEYMDLAVTDDSSRRVLVAGTYNCHPVPVAAGIACLRKLMNVELDVRGHLERMAALLEEGQRKAFSDKGVTATIVRQGSAHCAYFMDHAPVNWWDRATHHNHEFDARYRRALIERGIYLFPLPTKQGSISYAHSAEDIEMTLDATVSVLAELVGA